MIALCGKGVLAARAKFGTHDQRCPLIPPRDRPSVLTCRGVDPVLQQKCIQRSLVSDPTQPRPAIGRGFLSELRLRLHISRNAALLDGVFGPQAPKRRCWYWAAKFDSPIVELQRLYAALCDQLFPTS